MDEIEIKELARQNMEKFRDRFVQKKGRCFWTGSSEVTQDQLESLNISKKDRGKIHRDESGIVHLKAGPDMAQDFARKNDLETLETILEREEIPMPSYAEDDLYSVEMWRIASRIFAEQARGDIYVLMGDRVSATSVWESIERSTLEKNMAVTSITKIRLTTGEKELIYGAQVNMQRSTNSQNEEKIETVASGAKTTPVVSSGTKSKKFFEKEPAPDEQTNNQKQNMRKNAEGTSARFSTKDLQKQQTIIDNKYELSEKQRGKNNNLTK